MLDAAFTGGDAPAGEGVVGPISSADGYSGCKRPGASMRSPVGVAEVDPREHADSRRHCCAALRLRRGKAGCLPATSSRATALGPLPNLGAGNTAGTPSGPVAGTL